MCAIIASYFYCLEPYFKISNCNILYSLFVITYSYTCVTALLEWLRVRVLRGVDSTCIISHKVVWSSCLSKSIAKRYDEV